MTEPATATRRRRGGQPSALHRPLELPDGTRTTVAARVLDLVEHAVPLVHAAAAAGIDAGTLRSWLTIGGQVARDIATRKRTRTSLTAHEQACWEFSARTTQVRAGWVADTLCSVDQARRGGRRTVRTVDKFDADGNVVERVVTTEEEAPNLSAATWLLAHALPTEFGKQRLEVTGPDDGPVKLDYGNVATLAADVRAFIADRQAEAGQ